MKSKTIAVNYWPTEPRVDAIVEVGDHVAHNMSRSFRS